MPQSKQGVTSYLLFILWPFLSLVHAVMNYKAKYAKNIIWLFCAFFGYTFVFYTEGSDSMYYRKAFLRLASTPISIQEFFQTALQADYFNSFVQYVVSRFTNNYRILFLVYGLIYGYFYSRNIWQLLERVKDKLPIHTVVPILLFVFIIPFWNINGFRFYTATHIFFYGTTFLVSKKRKVFLLVAMLSILVHFSFVLPVSVLLFFVIVGGRPIIYLLAMLATMLFVELDLNTLLNNLPVVNDQFLNNKIHGYTGTQYMEKIAKLKAEQSWFITIRTQVMNTILFSFIFLVMTSYRRYIKDKLEEKMLLYGILLLSVTNVLSIVPSMGRFYLVSYLFIVFSMCLILINNANSLWLRRYSALAALPMLFYIIVEIRLGLQYIGLGTILSNPLITWILDHDMSLIDFYL